MFNWKFLLSGSPRFFKNGKDVTNQVTTKVKAGIITADEGTELQMRIKACQEGKLHSNESKPKKKGIKKWLKL